jgi:hypothetical protein
MGPRRDHDGGSVTPRVIAEVPVKFRRPNGEVRDGMITIGPPVNLETEFGCGAVISGLSTPPATIRGADPLQALRSALQFLAWELHAFVEAGGVVTDPEGEPMELEAVFGRLWAPTPKP